MHELYRLGSYVTKETTISEDNARSVKLHIYIDYHRHIKFKNFQNNHENSIKHIYIIQNVHALGFNVLIYKKNCSF